MNARVTIALAALTGLSPATQAGAQVVCDDSAGAAQTYRLEYQTVFEEKEITVQRPVWETEMRERRYTVARPVGG